MVSSTYSSRGIINSVSNDGPAFEGEDFKQSQHGISHIVKVKIPRITPESVRLALVMLGCSISWLVGI